MRKYRDLGQPVGLEAMSELERVPLCSERDRPGFAGRASIMSSRARSSTNQRAFTCARFERRRLSCERVSRTRVRGRLDESTVPVETFGLRGAIGRGAPAFPSSLRDEAPGVQRS